MICSKFAADSSYWLGLCFLAARFFSYSYFSYCINFKFNMFMKKNSLNVRDGGMLWKHPCTFTDAKLNNLQADLKAEQSPCLFAHGVAYVYKKVMAIAAFRRFIHIPYHSADARHFVASDGMSTLSRHAKTSTPLLKMLGDLGFQVSLVEIHRHPCSCND